MKIRLDYFLHALTTPPLYLLLLCLVCAFNLEAQNQKPNIIFILGDDVGYKALSCNGGNLYSTPNLDTMAAQGMRFTQCHASPLCSPSRVMLLTGKYNFRNYTKWGVLNREQKTIGNVMKEGGYKTAYYGKWQLDGGDTSIHTFGFDNYAVHNAFEENSENKPGPKYKNPHIYTNSAYLPDDEVENKYGDDIFTDSLFNFIEKNKTAPFFVYYSMILCHPPFAPTPDNQDFATWNTNNPGDTAYFPSMIKYMDKKIGQIIERVKSLGIADNTIILYVGDNGTSADVAEYSDENGIGFGGKNVTTEAGTHVPLIAYWPGTITPGTVNNDLIDFTDFLPTLADIGDIPVPTNYQPLDGISFYPRLIGHAGTPRGWTYCYYDHHPGSSTTKIWAQTATYKLYDLYDTSSSSHTFLFYNIENDKNEKHPISDSLLTPEEMMIKQQLLNVLKGYAAQSVPLLYSVPIVLSETDSSAIFKATINTNCNLPITSCGLVWGTDPNPTLATANHTLANKKRTGDFLDSLKRLTENTVYYVRTYAINEAGTAYSNQIKFTTRLHTIKATEATAITSNSFAANWESSANATGYRLDVSTSPTFTVSNSFTMAEGFNKGITPPQGWTISRVGIAANYTGFGTAAPSLQFETSGKQIITQTLTGVATELKFWIKALSTNDSSSLLIEGFDGYDWTTIEKVTNLPSTGTFKTYNASSVPVLLNKFIQFKFTFISSAGYLLFDDVSINYEVTSPSFVSGYDNVSIEENSKSVTGLMASTTYYYRVRALTDSNSSVNSNTISTTTCAAAALSFTQKNIRCNGSNNGTIILNVDGGVKPFVYKWTGPNGFTSAKKDIQNLSPGTYSVSVKYGETCSIDTSINITEPKAITLSAKAAPIICIDDTTGLTITATGGSGTYHYTLFDTSHILGSQNEAYFNVKAGSYFISVEDDFGCKTSSTITIKDGTTPCFETERFKMQVLPNPSTTEFILSIQSNSNEKIEITVTDIYGKVVYMATGNGNDKYIFGRTFISGMYIVKVKQLNSTQTLKLIKIAK